MYIREYRVTGTKQLSGTEVEEAVYPFLGPGRTSQDVEGARAALEKAYHDKGYQSVSVEIPPQNPRKGIISLNVVESTVGRLRVHGSRYFSLAEIKRKAGSMAEGRVPNFNDVTRDIIALNQLPDRRVTPELKPGIEPGTVDIDLTVKDKFPLHGNVELNNRYSADTTELRLNAGLNYNNLWQLGHSIGFNFQVAPEKSSDAKVYSAYYMARFPDTPWFSLLLSGTKQDSNVSTLGGAAVAGRGEIIGGRAIFTLPGGKDFYHSISLGFDYKHFGEDVIVGTDITQSPIDYYPASATYTASLIGKNSLTELDLGVNLHFRGLGSDGEEFNNKRYRADGSYIYLRGELSHTQDLPWLQLFGKVQGQLSSQPLVNNEQFAGGGLSSARGYLESAVLGDNALFGTFELRSPSFLGFLGKDAFEWRVYGFVDAGFVTLNAPLPEQVNRFDLASWGIGSRMKIFEYVGGSVDAAWPMITQGDNHKDDLLLTFRVWTEF